MEAQNELVAQSQFLAFEAVETLIKQGRVLIIGGSNALLRRLPAGDWVGGSAKHFLLDSTPQADEEKLMVADVTPYVSEVRMRTYSEYAIHNLGSDRYAHGFSVVLLPAFSAIHRAFALYAVTAASAPDSLLTGWVTSEEMDAQGESIPKVYCGDEGGYFTDKAVALHCRLRPEYLAQLDILTPSGEATGDVLRFDEAGFTVGDVMVNGQYQNLAKYWRAHYAGQDCFLMADLQGMPSILHPLAPIGQRSVTFVAPVIPGVEYHVARSTPGQLAHYTQQLAAAKALHPLLAFHCLAYYAMLRHGLQGAGAPDGIFAAGEVANVLMNRTSVVLHIKRLTL